MPLSDNPHESSNLANHSTKARSPFLTLGGVVLSAVVVLLLVALLLPAVRSAREPARRVQCANQLKQIAIGILNYESEHGTLPPAYTVDVEGNRLHSWRTLILPYLEGSQLFESIDLSKPWDDPANAEAREAVVQSYWCPSAFHAEGLTTYLGVFGPDCIFSGPVPRELSEVTDGPETTMLVVDVESDQAVHWMSPHDVSEEVVLTFGPESHTNHPGMIVAVFLDGHVESIRLDSDQIDLSAMLTIAGGEETGD